MRARSVEELLADARARLERLTPEGAAERQRDGALLIDVRLDAQRRRDGSVPGAYVISLNHLEWRLDPTSTSRIPEATDHDVEVVVVCDEGYCSSLAASRLHALGLHRATDIIGGFQAWRAAGLPVDVVEH
jgi:rhodanese-related sulfurtransferase